MLLHSASVSVTVNDPPTCNITGNNVICAGDNTDFAADAVSGATYSWTGTGGFTANTRVINNITQQEHYTVTVNDNGCTSSCSRTLTVNSNSGNANCYQ
jgi:hypothetical protein